MFCAFPVSGWGALSFPEALSTLAIGTRSFSIEVETDALVVTNAIKHGFVGRSSFWYGDG